MDLQTKLQCSSREKKNALARKQVYRRDKIRSKIPEESLMPAAKETISTELLKQCGMTKLYTTFKNLNIQTEFSLQKNARLNISVANTALFFHFCEESHVKVLEVSEDKKEILLNIKIFDFSDPGEVLHNSLLVICYPQFLVIHTRKIPESVSTLDAFHKHSLPRIVYENVAEFTRVKLDDDWQYYFRRPLKKGDPRYEHSEIINGQRVVYKHVDDVWFENYPDQRNVYTWFQTVLEK